MDSFWVIVLFILFAIFSDRKDKKKPVPKRRIPDFPQRPLPDIPQLKRERRKIEIPELRGAPSLPDIQTSAEVETQDVIRAQQERYQEMLRRKKKQREQAEKRAESQRVEQAQAPQNTVTLSNLQQAVIWSEILGKPKARR
jgi:hypothetical protein